jgi:hypothetical protein
MWTTSELGLATWNDSGSRWSFDARGGDQGISIHLPDPGQRSVCFSPVDQARLPRVDEQFVRGDSWHLNYPQGSGRYAVHVAWKPILTTLERLVIEALISIQTDLLDSHPTIDLEVECQSIQSIVPPSQSRDRGDPITTVAATAPISIAIDEPSSVAVLLGPHDRPFTTDLSTDSRLRLRLFGEFLEKGVIRRGRPWIVIDRSGQPLAADPLISLWQQQLASPVPLS